MALVALGLPAAAGSAISRAGVAVDGKDWVWAQVPPAAPVEPYRNDGYQLRIEDGAVVVEVGAAPLASRALFVPPSIRAGDAEDPIVQVARTVTAGSVHRYDAVSRVLAWVAANVRYHLDRAEPQDPLAVLERRSGYCSGVARLAVAMLGAVGITAREVPGFVVGEGGGYHRWIEVYYPDRGWSFSDPLRSHHYVPATYIRLANERLLDSGDPLAAALLRREDHRQPADLYPGAPSGITARRNEPRQNAGVLRVTVDGPAVGTAILEGEGRRRVRTLSGGATTFVGIEPGSYLLEVLSSGRALARKRVVFRDRVIGAVHIADAG